MTFSHHYKPCTFSAGWLIKGFSDYDFTPGYERTIKYDYRNYDKEADNILLKGLVLQIKEGYENGE